MCNVNLLCYLSGPHFLLFWKCWNKAGAPVHSFSSSDSQHYSLQPCQAQITVLCLQNKRAVRLVWVNMREVDRAMRMKATDHFVLCFGSHFLNISMAWAGENTVIRDTCCFAVRFLASLCLVNPLPWSCWGDSSRFWYHWARTLNNYLNGWFGDSLRDCSESAFTIQSNLCDLLQSGLISYPGEATVTTQ